LALVNLSSSIRLPAGALRAALGLAAVSVGSALVTVALLARPDQMLVEVVRFEGIERAGASELRHLVDVRNGTRVWELDPEAVAAKVTAHPWVHEATARVDWPDTLVVEVVEREAVAVLHADRALYVDAEGTPFLAARGHDADLPHITGIPPQFERLHPDLPGMAVRDSLWLLDQLDRRGLGAREAVSEIAFSEVRGFTVHLGHARLVFGHGDLPRQLDRLERLVREQGVDLTEPTFVDLAPPTVAIVRPLPAAIGG
jgi:hypothetical protein